MSKYKIKQRSYSQAQKLGVTLKPSSNPKKKIDVFKGEKKVASIGAYGMLDYPTYLQQRSKEYADTRRRLYRARHRDTAKRVGSPSFYAWHILW